MTSIMSMKHITKLQIFLTEKNPTVSDRAMTVLSNKLRTAKWTFATLSSTIPNSSLI